MKPLKIQYLKDDIYQGFIFVVENLNLPVRCHQFASYEYHFAFPISVGFHSYVEFFKTIVPKFNMKKKEWREDCRAQIESDLNKALENPDNRHYLVIYILEREIELTP